MYYTILYYTIMIYSGLLPLCNVSALVCMLDWVVLRVLCDLVSNLATLPPSLPQGV